MPRTNRFNVPFSERLRQSRVARGLEAPTPAPAERIRAREAHDWGFIAHEVNAMRDAMLRSDPFAHFAALIAADARPQGISFSEFMHGTLLSGRGAAVRTSSGRIVNVDVEA
ncbi:MAG: hypothetical protein K2Y33_20825, partial [Mycolicibacterium frederiksbergense]|nr:hypothetical protein [Mycolicibacterium frederiksbergense]